MWPGASARFEVLGGGITNHNLKVEVDGERSCCGWPARTPICSASTAQVELAATEAAAALGIGPEVVAFVEPEGWLVTRFVDGRDPAARADARAGDARARGGGAAGIPRRPGDSGTFDSFRVVETYRQTALDARRARARPIYDWAHEIAGRIEAKRSADAPVPCHNDLLNANFLDDGERLRIVDWEYAGMGDRFFDLANFSINHELDDAASAALLEAYFGEVRDEDVAGARAHALHVRLPRGDVGVVQSAVSELDFDFDAYATEHFERLRRTAESPAFRAARARA